MREYLKAQNKTTDAVITNTFSTDELERFSRSDYRWADSRSKSYRYKHKPVKKEKYINSNLVKTSSPKCLMNTGIL